MQTGFLQAFGSTTSAATFQNSSAFCACNMNPKQWTKPNFNTKLQLQQANGVNHEREIADHRSGIVITSRKRKSWTKKSLQSNVTRNSRRQPKRHTRTYKLSILNEARSPIDHVYHTHTAWLQWFRKPWRRWMVGGEWCVGGGREEEEKR